MLTTIRLNSHQLYKPRFNQPEDLVDWMGAIQAQDYTKSKWAVGVRLHKGKLSAVDQAYLEGKIVRTHILRPTWHLVSGKDIRWMMKLTGPRMIKAMASWAKTNKAPEEVCVASVSRLEKILEGTSMTKQEVTDYFVRENILTHEQHIGYVLGLAEANCIICSGPDREGKPTYALLEERVAPVKEITIDESLALLALKYFRSHSPATLTDFSWWSGLPLTEARKAISLMKDELIEDRFDGDTVWIHESCGRSCRKKEIVHLLPAYDEYLISYKDRSSVIDPEHYSKAYNNFGIFRNVVLYQGKIVANWERSVKKGSIVCKATPFTEAHQIPQNLIDKAVKRYSDFYNV